MSKLMRTVGKTLLGACLASLIASPAVNAETVKPDAPATDGTSSSGTPAAASNSPTPPGASTSSTPPVSATPATSATPTQPVQSKGDTGSAASIDNFIPGSEMLPTAQSSSDDFVKNQKPSMDLALLLHKNREFKQALTVLQKLPQNDQTRYYTGLCYKGLGNQREATTQFAWLAYYAKDARIKEYAFAAIRSMRPTRPTKVDRGGSTSTKFSSAEARQRSEEITSRIQAQLRNRAAREGNNF